MRDSHDGSRHSPHQNAVFWCDAESDATPAQSTACQSGRKLEPLFAAAHDASEVIAIHDRLRPRAFVLAETVTGISLSLALACLVTVLLSVCLVQDERAHERTFDALQGCERRCPVIPEVVIEGDPRATLSRIDDAAVGP